MGKFLMWILLFFMLYLTLRAQRGVLDVCGCSGRVASALGSMCSLAD